MFIITVLSMLSTTSAATALRNFSLDFKKPSLELVYLLIKCLTGDTKYYTN